MENTLELKRSVLEKDLQELQRVLVAYSGGVDSSLLLACAQNVLGENVLAVTLVSPLMTEEEIQNAARFAKELGVNHLQLEVPHLEIKDIVANSPDRCYHCKKAGLKALKDLAYQKGIPWVVEGSNAEDLLDYRPGYKAVQELGVGSPLAQAGLSKKDVRRLARQLNLPQWDKPASPCLATRIPYGTTITPERLERVRQAEIYLRHLLGTSELRVRDHGDVARLEIPPTHFSRLMANPNNQDTYQELKKLGYAYVALDLLGYRQGSMNEQLTPESTK